MSGLPNVMSAADRAERGRKRTKLLETTGTRFITGEAGTGKTTKLAEDWREAGGGFITTPTHRAAHVLRSKLPEAEGLIGTIHSILVDWVFISDEAWVEGDMVTSVLNEARLRGPSRDDFLEKVGDPLTVDDRLFDRKNFRRIKAGGRRGRMVGVWSQRLTNARKPIAVDECSMVGDWTVRQMIRLAPNGILGFYGDVGQIAPVKAAPFWIDVDPSTLLTKNWRQQGPLLDTVQRVRRAQDFWEANNVLPFGTIPDDIAERIMAGGTVAIAWTNRSVGRFNRLCRARLDLSPDRVEPGEPLIVSDNLGDVGLYNNQPVTVTSRLPNGSVLLDALPDTPVRLAFAYDGKSDAAFATRLTDGTSTSTVPMVPVTSGFCLTAHKAQGGEWPEVYVIDESEGLNGMKQRQAREEPSQRWGPSMILTPAEEVVSWLYTAATRAQRGLTFENVRNWTRRSGAIPDAYSGASLTQAELADLTEGVAS